MTAERDQAMTAWVKQQFVGAEIEIVPLAGDASFRRYARVRVDGQPYMLMDAPPPQEDCRPFVTIADMLLAYGVRVPKIIAQDLAQGFLLLEDFGDTVLSAVLSAETVDQYYQQAMNQLIDLQKIDVPAASALPDYHADKLIAEMRLFDQWFLPQFLQMELSQSEQDLLSQTYQYLAEQALAQPQVLVHRDYHSRNLMVLADESSLGVIDFQDAVIGAISYDLVSLLRDAYVQWPDAQVKGWIKTYWQRAQVNGLMGQVSLAQFEQWFDAMAAQRHLKVLGIFVRLSQRDGKHGYLNDLPLVLSY
ncbi:MAG: phosphotransferase, partial [Pseudomonadota bacterium]|nr:phosphotransferase [Pseudomonadota bacterium]